MSLFALIDCNNFFASCERVFNPKLIGRPVIVLSNNDGCAIARSEEAKALGIEMGAPYFKIKNLCDKQGVAVFSSNFELYGDMSQRVMDTIAMFAPDMEVYSIDEAFIQLDSLNIEDPIAFCDELRQKILQWTGLPVSIGIGPTKVLAKTANYIAKKKLKTPVYYLQDATMTEDWLKKLDVAEIWGIGRKWAQKLKAQGICTALHLRNTNLALLRKRYTVIMERIAYELAGTSCLSLDELDSKRSILSSRSFAHKVTDLETIEEALCNFVAKAAEKLRRQRSRARSILVSLRTSYFNPNDPQYRNTITIPLLQPSADTGELMAIAKDLLKKIYRSGYRYHKVSVLLFDLVSENAVQTDLFSLQDYSKSDTLMKLLDKVNNTQGKNTLFFASQGLQRNWQGKSDLRSKRYTTEWNELLRVG